MARQRQPKVTNANDDDEYTEGGYSSQEEIDAAAASVPPPQKPPAKTPPTSSQGKKQHAQKKNQHPTTARQSRPKVTTANDNDESDGGDSTKEINADTSSEPTPQKPPAKTPPASKRGTKKQCAPRTLSSIGNQQDQPRQELSTSQQQNNKLVFTSVDANPIPGRPTDDDGSWTDDQIRLFVEKHQTFLQCPLLSAVNSFYPHPRLKEFAEKNANRHKSANHQQTYRFHLILLDANVFSSFAKEYLGDHSISLADYVSEGFFKKIFPDCSKVLEDDFKHPFPKKLDKRAKGPMTLMIVGSPTKSKKKKDRPPFPYLIIGAATFFFHHKDGAFVSWIGIRQDHYSKSVWGKQGDDHAFMNGRGLGSFLLMKIQEMSMVWSSGNSHH